MGEVVAAAQGSALDEVAVFARHGQPASAARASIGFASLRGGDIVGDHTVVFAGTGERIEITHRAAQPRHVRRRQPARGALRPGRKKSGLFGMDEVLGLAPAVATTIGR